MHTTLINLFTTKGVIHTLVPSNKPLLQTVIGIKKASNAISILSNTTKPINAALAKCTLNKKGRLIERSEYQPYFEQNKKNIEANPLVYKKRQSIIEHNYGIIKRQWGFYYISTKKGINRAGADVGLIFCAYNLRRLTNLVDKNLLKKFLGELLHILFGKIAIMRSIVRPFFGTMIFTRSSLNQIIKAKSSFYCLPEYLLFLESGSS